MLTAMVFLGASSPADELGAQRALREKIRRAKAGLDDPNSRPRKLYEDDMIDLTAPRRGVSR
jgi:hypothetical protein